MDAGFAISSLSESFYAGKTLADRLTGKFYTPDIIGLHLAEHVAEVLETSNYARRGTDLRICDPFSGDGRLLLSFLAVLAQRAALSRLNWTFTVRDMDNKAAATAARELHQLSSRLGVRLHVRVVTGDSFDPAQPEQHHAVITNPPWELLKPDTRELSCLSHRAASQHRECLKAMSAKLDAQFPEAKAVKAWGGWGTNLARCGWELALRSCLPGGALGIVLPSSLFSDQASSNMRRSVFSRATLYAVSSYPPEARLFARVDQPVVAATFQMAPSEGGVNASFYRFDANRTVSNVSKLVIAKSELVSQDHIIPVGFGIDARSLLARLSQFPQWRDLEGDGPAALWAGRELDETRLSAKLVRGRRYPFVKGRMIQRHSVVEAPTWSVRADLACKLRSIHFERLVWRDVARSSQRRRMIAAIIPPTWVTGNSLHVAHFKDADPVRLRALYAVVSSFVFELQVRSRLATGHMSLGTIRTSTLPTLRGALVSKLAATATRAMQRGDNTTMEIAVARSYGLDRDEMAEVLSQFPKLDAEEREAILSPKRWSKEAK